MHHCCNTLSTPPPPSLLLWVYDLLIATVKNIDPVPKTPYGFCGRTATMKKQSSMSSSITFFKLYHHSRRIRATAQERRTSIVCARLTCHSCTLSNNNKKGSYLALIQTQQHRPEPPTITLTWHASYATKTRLTDQ